MITTLPYPSMDFVPMDILTASELDQIVANIEAVNNAMIGNSAISANAISNDKIDWSTIVGNLTDTAFGNGYIDFGTIRLQWLNRQKTGLNTSAGGYTQWTENLPVSFGSGNYAVIGFPISDTGNISGDTLKIYAKTATSISLNYSHTGAIGGGTLNYSIIAIGKKP